jgi:hypothetical protein
MDDQKQQDDRWRETMELLGLTDDAPAPAKKEAPPAPVVPPPEAPAIKAYEEPRSIPEHTGRIEEETPRLPIHHEHDAPTIPMTRDEPPTDWEGEFDEEDEDTPLDEVQEPLGEGPQEVVEEGSAENRPPVAGEEEKPRRGRRRRRRGRRRGGDNEQGEGQPNRAPAPAASGPPAREPVEPRPARPVRDAEPDPRDRRGPRRGNRRDEQEPRRPVPAPARQERREPEPMEVDDFQDEQPAIAGRGNALSASDTDFSDWNVPSWQDLISSLYRPDR